MNTCNCSTSTCCISGSESFTVPWQTYQATTTIGYKGDSIDAGYIIAYPYYIIKLKKRPNWFIRKWVWLITFGYINI